MSSRELRHRRTMLQTQEQATRLHTRCTPLCATGATRSPHCNHEMVHGCVFRMPLQTFHERACVRVELAWSELATSDASLGLSHFRIGPFQMVQAARRGPCWNRQSWGKSACCVALIAATSLDSGLPLRDRLGRLAAASLHGSRRLMLSFRTANRLALTSLGRTKASSRLSGPSKVGVVSVRLLN